MKTYPNYFDEVDWCEASVLRSAYDEWDRLFKKRKNIFKKAVSKRAAARAGTPDADRFQMRVLLLRIYRTFCLDRDRIMNPWPVGEDGSMYGWLMDRWNLNVSQKMTLDEDGNPEVELDFVPLAKPEPVRLIHPPRVENLLGGRGFIVATPKSPKVILLVDLASDDQAIEKGLRQVRREMKIERARDKKGRGKAGRKKGVTPGKSAFKDLIRLQLGFKRLQEPRRIKNLLKFIDPQEAGHKGGVLRN